MKEREKKEETERRMDAPTQGKRKMKQKRNIDLRDPNTKELESAHSTLSLSLRHTHRDRQTQTHTHTHTHTHTLSLSLSLFDPLPLSLNTNLSQCHRNTDERFGPDPRSSFKASVWNATIDGCNNYAKDTLGGGSREKSIKNSFTSVWMKHTRLLYPMLYCPHPRYSESHEGFYRAHQPRRVHKAIEAIFVMTSAVAFVLEECMKDGTLFSHPGALICKHSIYE